MEIVNWKDLARWSNEHPDSFVIVWDVRRERTLLYHWRKFIRGIRKPSNAYRTGYVTRKVNGGLESVAAIVSPEFAYFIEPEDGFRFVLDDKSIDKFEPLMEHLRSKGLDVEVYRFD